MTNELALLLGHKPELKEPPDYEKAIVEENILRKSTHSGKISTYKILLKHYTLNDNDVFYHLMKKFCIQDRMSLPLLASLYSIYKDPIFRIAAEYIVSLQPGTGINSQNIADYLNPIIGDKYTFNTLRSLSQNIGSSWTQAGHLSGKVLKTRELVKPTWVAAAYAFTIGFLQGSRGTALFETLWAKVLDADRLQLEELAFQAARHGVLDFRASGEVVEFSFDKILPASVLGEIHGKD